MEAFEGDSPKGPTPFADAWKIAMQIVDTLECAHEKAVIHRDLKPANVKVTPDGVVRLLDFGLTKAFSPDRESAALGSVEKSPTLTIGGTEVGVILGTAAYTTPEQAKGKKVDKRADLWSWGVMLYELLTGERLFKGDDAGDTLAQVLTKEPDLQRVPARKLERTTPDAVCCAGIPVLLLLGGVAFADHKGIVKHSADVDARHEAVADSGLNASGSREDGAVVASSVSDLIAYLVFLSESRDSKYQREPVPHRVLLISRIAESKQTIWSILGRSLD